MVVCKLLTDRGDYLTPPHFSFRYYTEKLYTTDISFSKDYRFFDSIDHDIVVPLDVCGVTAVDKWLEDNGYVSISKGFHSISLDMYKDYFVDDCVPYKCIIPAGSEVFTNEDTGLIVSNQIIVVGRLD